MSQFWLDGFVCLFKENIKLDVGEDSGGDCEGGRIEII